MNKKRGMTLIELMVSMTIFAVVMMVAVGAFISMNNLRAVALNARESQQKLRMALEMISRYSRQAERVVLTEKPAGEPDNGKYKGIEMFFNLGANEYREKFVISGDQLLYSEFTSGSWSAASNILGNDVKLNNDVTRPEDSFFQKNVPVSLRKIDDGTISQSPISMPPSLSIKLDGKIDNNNLYYQNNFDIETRVILENIK